MATRVLDLDDIQGNVTPGFRSDFQDLLFVRFPNAAVGRQWLRALYSEVTSAKELVTFAQVRSLVRHPPTITSPAYGTIPPRTAREVIRTVRTTWINVALTAAGLETILGSAAIFPRPFVDGMSERGGTTGDHAAEIRNWRVRDRPGDGDATGARVAHAVLILGADVAADLNAERATQVARMTALGMTLFQEYRGSTLGRGREHFGFQDAISQPEPPADQLLNGWTTSPDVVEPGELILGQPLEAGGSAFSGPTWAKNGSYMVFRRLRQDVVEFRHTVQAGAAALAPVLNPMSEALFAAELVGRWPGGSNLVRPTSSASQETSDPFPLDGSNGDPPPSRVTLTDADFTGDTRGDVCPVFAHVRRAHPRASAGQKPREHRIFRRGIPYGAPLPDGTVDTEDRGLLFVAYQADIKRGFEKIQGQWLSNGDTPEELPGLGPANGWDPITGFANYTSPTTSRNVRFHVPGGAAPGTRQDIPIGRLVEVTAGGYFFTPSIGALAHLSS